MYLILNTSSKISFDIRNKILYFYHSSMFVFLNLLLCLFDYMF